MRATIFFLFLSISAQAQTVFQRVIASSDGLDIHQSLKVNDSTLANWYYNDTRSFFGTTTFDCAPFENYEFTNPSFSRIFQVKGLVGSQDEFYSLVKYNNSASSALESALICHNTSGAVIWQKKLESMNSAFLTGTDMAYVNDSVIGVVSLASTGSNSIIHLINKNGNLQNSFEVSGARLNMIEPNNDSTFWILGPQTTSSIFKTLLVDMQGNKLKEFGVSGFQGESAVFHNQVLKILLDASQNSDEVFVELDSTGIISAQRFSATEAYLPSFVDLIPFNDQVARVQGQEDEQHIGLVSFYGANKHVLVDEVKTSGFVPLDSVNAFVYSRGPAYGVKSSQWFPIPHIGVTLIDSSLTGFYSCSVYHDYDVQGTPESIVLDETENLIIGNSGSLSNAGFSLVSLSVFSANTCLDHYDNLNENNYTELQLSPNPGDNIVVITQPDSPINRIEISSLNGNIISEISSLSPITSFDITELSNGVYLLKSWSNSGQIYLNRFIKK